MKFLLVVALAAFACAEPEADPAFAYSTAGVLPYAHVVPYAGCTNNDGALVPCAHGGFVAPAVVAAPAAAAVEEAPGVSVEKREAEPVGEATADAEADPEADPWLYYSGLYGGHYGYAAHHYTPFSYSYAPYTYRHAYAHYGLPYAYYGKRSADPMGPVLEPAAAHHYA